MKKYRLCYDKTFIAKRCIEGFEYKGEMIEALQIYFEYQVLDKTGHEKFFTCSDNEEMKEQFIDGYDLNSFYKCCYDRNSKCGYIMTPTEIAKKSDFNVIYSVDSCFKVLCDEAYPTLISYEEFCDILLNNAEHFDISDNKPAQSVSYGANEIKEVCHCELCNSMRAERQFALSDWEDKYILWDVDEAIEFNTWAFDTRLDTDTVEGIMGEAKRIPVDFPIVKLNEESEYLLVYGVVIPNPLKECDLTKEAEAYKNYGHFTLLDGKMYESVYSDIWLSPDKVHSGKDIPCAILLKTSLDLNKKRSYGFGYTMTVRYKNEKGLMDIFSNIMNRSFALCVKDVVKVLPEYTDDWKKYIDEAACIETARGIF